MNESDGAILLRDCGESAGEAPRESESAHGPERNTEQIPLTTERCEGGRFESRFGLALESFVRDEHWAPDATTYDGFILDHVLAATTAGQRLQFVLRRNAGRYGVPKVELALIGRAEGDSGAEAESAALALNGVLRHVLAARTDCGFNPIVTDREPLPHAYEVHMGGVLLTTETKPASVPKGTPVIVPALSLVEWRVPFWDALMSCAFAVEVEVTMSPACLNGDALAALAHAYVSLDTPKMRCETLPDRQWLNAEQIRLMRDFLGTELTRWLRMTCGVRMDIQLRTEEAMPPGALRWLAQTLVPLRRIDVRPAAERADELGNCVDLRYLVNEAKVMPALLPGRAMLRELGLVQRFVAPAIALAADGLLLGRVGEREVRLTEADRNRHCYVVGASGCGKTSLLINMIRQDIASGQGVAVIDPHGDLYRDVLASIPEGRVDDVVLFDPTDLERATGLNYLDIAGVNSSVERSFVANELLKIFDRLYDLRHTGGPMFEQYARNALLLLMESSFRGLTLAEVPLIFEDEEFRTRLVRRCTNAAVARFWRRQAEKARTDASLSNMAPYITSKFNQFTGNALVRAIIGQSRSSIDFRDVLDERRILLVNLSKGLLGEFDSALLGMLLVSKLFLAALARARQRPEQRAPFALYIDEFQNFTTDTVASLLSEARKFNLRCILANQFMTQVDSGRSAGNVLSAVLGNVGTMMAMRVGAPDAKDLSGLMTGRLAPQILQSLPDYHVAARLLQDGRPLDPFVFETIAPASIEECREVQESIRRCWTSKYTRSVTEVEREIEERVRRVLSSEEEKGA